MLALLIILAAIVILIIALCTGLGKAFYRLWPGILCSCLVNETLMASGWLVRSRIPFGGAAFHGTSVSGAVEKKQFLNFYIISDCGAMCKEEKRRRICNATWLQ